VVELNASRARAANAETDWCGEEGCAVLQGLEVNKRWLRILTGCLRDGSRLSARSKLCFGRTSLSKSGE
jgi:hypothetical protein